MTGEKPSTLTGQTTSTRPSQNWRVKIERGEMGKRGKKSLIP